MRLPLRAFGFSSFVARYLVRTLSLSLFLIQIPLFSGALLSGALLFPRNLQALTLDDFSGESSVEVAYGEPVVTEHLAGGSVGGGRTLSGEALSGGAGRGCALRVGEGVVSHSQDAFATGVGSIIWDGDADGTTVNYDGLGGIDLTQDGGTALRITIATFDLPAGEPVQLGLFLFDARNSSGGVSSWTMIPLTEAVTTPKVIEIPFTSFKARGGGGADVRNIGAIVLTIDGSQVTAVDLAIDSITTNGSCASVPGPNGSVFDVCGICGGDGTSCLDCAGVPFGAAKNDRCGVCQGDGTSCLDCLGVPFGVATLDRCGVCAGDGTSCLGCVEEDQQPVLIQLDGDSKDQEALVRSILTKLKRARKDLTTRSYISSTLAQARDLHLKNWTLSWTLPPVGRQCTHEVFCSQESTAPITAAYRSNAKGLRDLALSAARELQSATRRPQRSFVRKAKALYTKCVKLSRQVPEYQSVCS